MFVGMMNTTTAQRPQNTIHDIKILVSNILLYVLCIYFAFYVVRVLNNPFILLYIIIYSTLSKLYKQNKTHPIQQITTTTTNPDYTGNQQ